MAPRLVAAAEKPAASSESSGSDVSAPNSVPGSRRASVSKTEIKSEEIKEEVKAIGDSTSQADDESPVESEETTNISPEPEKAELKSEETTTEHTEETKTDELSNSDNEIETNNEAGDSGFEHIKVTEIASSAGDIQSTLDAESKDTNENQMEIDS